MQDGNSVNIQYLGNVETITDELGHKKQETHNIFSKLTKVVESDPSGVLAYESDYTYDGNQNVMQIDQCGALKTGGCSQDRQRLFKYDGLSRLVSETSPEAGTTNYGYDPNGNVTSKKDARGITSTSTFDYINRISQVTYSDGSPAKSFGYDGYVAAGQPIALSTTNAISRLTYSSNGATAGSEYSYDAEGRVISQLSALPSTCCSPTNAATVQASYDLAGDLISLTYPDGRVITRTFDTARRISSVLYSGWNGTSMNTTLASSSTYTPTNQLASEILGNGILLSASFSPRKTIAKLSYSKAGSQLWSKQYTWDANATNLLQITDLVQGNGTRYYSYDTLGRVTSATGGGTTLVTPASSASGSFTVSGTDGHSVEQICIPNEPPPGQTCHNVNIPDTGSLSISIAGRDEAVAYNSTSTPATLASAFETAINGDSDAVVTSAISGSVVSVTAKGAGVDTNYPITGSTTPTDFSVTASGANLTGGNNAVYSGLGSLSESFTYDPFGNLQQSGNFNFLPPSSYSAPFSTSNAINVTGYTYDSAGNALKDGLGNTYTYEASGHMSTGAGDSYTYGADYQRAAKTNGAGSTEYVYFNNVLLAMRTVSSGSWNDLIYDSSSMIALAAGTQNGEITYHSVNHIGSTAFDSDASANVLGQVEYAAYGEVFQGSTSDPFAFAGLEADGSGLHTLDRQMSVSEGRWMSPDPQRGSYDLSNPQSFNRYAYAMGNPLHFTDKDGRDVFCVSAIYAGTVVAFGCQVFSALGELLGDFDAVLIDGAIVLGVETLGIAVAIDIAIKLIEDALRPKFNGSLKSRPMTLNADQCQAAKTILQRESDYGTANAALMSGNTFGDATLNPFNSTYYPNLQTPRGELDLDWFTDLTATHWSLYPTAKLAWTFIRATQGLKIGYGLPFSDSGETNAFTAAYDNTHYSDIFTAAVMKQACP